MFVINTLGPNHGNKNQSSYAEGKSDSKTEILSKDTCITYFFYMKYPPVSDIESSPEIHTPDNEN